MTRGSTLVLAGALSLAAAGGLAFAQQGRRVRSPNAPKAPIPDGFTPIFNGKDTGRLARQPDQPSRHDAGVPRRRRHHRRHAGARAARAASC